MKLTVRDELTNEDIVNILNEIEFIKNVSLADKNRITGTYKTVEKVFKKLFEVGSFGDYRSITKQLESGLIDIVPILESLNIQGLDFNEKYLMFYIDSEFIERQIYLKAIQTFGEEYQKVRTIKGMANLIQEISKSLISEKHNIEEEIADVEIMLGQLKEMEDVDKNLIEQFTDEKLRRLEGLVW